MPSWDLPLAPGAIMAQEAGGINDDARQPNNARRDRPPAAHVPPGDCPRARPRDRGPRLLSPAGGKLGAIARLSGKMARQGPVAVRLEPCGLATARLVGPDGKPVTGRPRGVMVTMVVTPGRPSTPQR